MPRITFISADGTAQTVEAKPGDSVMQTAMAHGIDAITAECGRVRRGHGLRDLPCLRGR